MLSRSFIASALMILVALFTQFATESKSIPPLRSLSQFPTTIGQWHGRISYFDQKIYDILGVDDSFLCDYMSPNGEKVNLYIGYYSSQKEGELIHSPKNCMPGAGWNIIRTSLLQIEFPKVGPKKVIKLVLKKGTQRQVMLYWFQSRGRIISSEYWQKIYLVYDSIFKQRTDGSFVRLMAPVVKGEEQTTRCLVAFAQELYPILDRYIPGIQCSTCTLASSPLPLA